MTLVNLWEEESKGKSIFHPSYSTRGRVPGLIVRLTSSYCILPLPVDVIPAFFKEIPTITLF